MTFTGETTRWFWYKGKIQLWAGIGDREQCISMCGLIEKQFVVIFAEDPRGHIPLEKLSEKSGSATSPDANQDATGRRPPSSKPPGPGADETAPSIGK